MDPSGRPFLTLGPPGAPSNAGPSSGTTAHSNPMLPPAMTAAPNFFPQGFPLVNQNLLPIYLSARNSFVRVPNQHTLPQTAVYNQTVQANSDSSVQTRFIQISVTNNAVSSQQNLVRQQNSMTFAESNQRIPPFLYQTSAPVTRGVRPLASGATMSPDIRHNGAPRSIRVRWNDPSGGVPGIMRPPPPSTTQETSVASQHRQVSSRCEDSRTGLRSRELDPRDSGSSLPQIPTKRVYPSNDPRLSDCKVQIPPKLSVSRHQRDPRSSIIVPRILERFRGSHGCVPPADPRTVSSEPKDSPGSAPQQTNTASVPCSEASSSDRRDPQRIAEESLDEARSATLRKTESDNPKKDAQLSESRPEGVDPSEVQTVQQTQNQTPETVNENSQSSEDTGKMDVEAEGDPIEQTDTCTRISGDVASCADGGYAVERESVGDYTESDGSPEPEDPRQERYSRAQEPNETEAASHERDLSPSPDFAEDPRLRAPHNDRGSREKHNSSVYTHVSRPDAVAEESQEAISSKSGSDSQSPTKRKRLERPAASEPEVTKVREDVIVDQTRSIVEGSQEEVTLNSAGAGNNELGRIAEGEKPTHQAGHTPAKPTRRRVIDFIDSDDPESPLTGKVRVSEDKMKQETIPTPVPQTNWESPSSNNPAGIPEEEAPPSTDRGIRAETIKKPRRRRRGADTITLSESKIIPSVPRKRRRTGPSDAEADPGLPDVLREEQRSGKSFDIDEALLRVPRKRAKQRIYSDSDEESHQNANLAQEVDSKAVRPTGKPNVKLRVLPKTGQAQNDIHEQSAINEGGSFSRSDERSPLTNERSSSEAVPVVAAACGNQNKESENSRHTDVSNAITTTEERSQPGKEEDMLEKHESGNAKLVYDKICEFTCAFDLEFPLRVRDDQMTTLFGILDDILEQSCTDVGAGPTYAVVSKEPEQETEAETSHKEESVKETSAERRDEITPQEEVTEQKEIGGIEEETGTEVPEKPCKSSISKLLEPFGDQNVWSPYLRYGASGISVPVVVLSDILLRPSTTRTMRLPASEISKRELICEQCSFACLNTLSLKEHVEGCHAQES